MEKSIKYSIFISVIIACTIFLGFKQFKITNWNRCISSDGKGYYAYLPAVFIYDDLEFNFIHQYEAKYYQPENGVTFTNDFNGKNVNKYWMGTAVLMSPFFLMAHGFASVFQLPNDGYSFTYQVMIAVSACFYLLLGLFYMRRILLLYKCKEIDIFIALFAIVFATNLFYYTVAEPSMSHVYSMAAVSAFVYFAKMYFETLTLKYLKFAAVVLGIIILIRPSNVIVLFALPFLAGSANSIKIAFKKIKFYDLVSLFIAVLLIVSMQLFYYYKVAGSIYIYSYGNEKFNFFAPKFIDFLFSYRRGLFVYAPVLFLSLLGIFTLTKKSGYQAKTLSIFLIVMIYFLSSWWMWYYGGGFGMRPVIDFLVFFSIPLALLVNSILKVKYYRWIGIFAISTCVLLAQIQTYQKVNFILPWDGINKEIYWKLFLKTDPSYIGKYTNANNDQ